VYDPSIPAPMLDAAADHIAGFLSEQPGRRYRLPELATTLAISPSTLYNAYLEPKLAERGVESLRTGRRGRRFYVYTGEI